MLRCFRHMPRKKAALEPKPVVTAGKGRVKPTDSLSALLPIISPNMANMAILRSSHAHAHINNINLSAAYESDGVIDVFSSGDLGFNQPEIPIRLAPLAGFENFLQHPLAEGRVRYVGEPLAVVVAEDRYLAEDALSKIQVDYEILDAVTNIDDALTDALIIT